MMNSSFLRRLKYYGIGFGLGCIFVFFFFRNRGCTWTPANRVKNNILGRVITIHETDEALLNSKGISIEDAISALNDGDVEFGDSKKGNEDNPKVYVIEKEIPSKGWMRFYYTLPTESYITEVRVGVADAKSVENSKRGTAKLMRLPVEKDLFFIDTMAMDSCSKSYARSLNADKLMKLVKKKSWIDFEKSNLMAEPKAEQFIYFLDKNDTIGFQSIWYQEKINVTQFYLPEGYSCQ